MLPLPLPHCRLPCSQYRLPWAVNYTVVQPGGCRLLCTVGDDPTAHVYDAASGRQVAALKGHSDYSFAAAWHPDGNVIATGNQVGRCTWGRWAPFASSPVCALLWKPVAGTSIAQLQLS